MILPDSGISVGITDSQVLDNEGNGGEGGIRTHVHSVLNRVLYLAELLPIMISVVVKVVQQILKARFSINTGETFASRRIGGVR